MAAKNVIGINFGHSFSSISLINKEGLADCIANEDGERQIAVALSFAGDEEYVGTPARAQLVRNAQNTVVGFRDLVGKSQSELSSYAPRHSSAAAAISQNGATFKLNPSDSKEVVLSAHEASVRYLKSLLASGEDFLGSKLDAAVFAIPPSFTDDQKTALEAVAREAGVVPLQLISEATAAALAYGLQAPVTEAGPPHTVSGGADANIVVLDVGATTTTVTVLAARGGLYTVLAEERNASLGGDQLDDLLVEHFSKEFTKKSKVKIEKSNSRSIMKLKLACETTKRTLSASNSATCSIDSLAEGIDFHGNINRLRFDLLASKTYGSVVDLVVKAVQAAKLDPLDVQQVILAGGSTRLPAFTDRLRDTFSPSTSILSTIDPDEVIAKGAVLHARALLRAPTSADPSSADAWSSFSSKLVSASSLKAPHTARPLGIVVPAPAGDKRAVDGKLFVSVIEAETPLPVRRTIEVPAEKVGEVVLSFWEGESDVLVEKPEKTSNGAKAADGDDADEEDEDEEEEDIRTAFVKPTTALADVEVKITDSKTKGQKGAGTVRFIIKIDEHAKGSVEASQVGVEGEAVKASW